MFSRCIEIRIDTVLSTHSELRKMSCLLAVFSVSERLGRGIAIENSGHELGLLRAVGLSRNGMSKSRRSQAKDSLVIGALSTHDEAIICGEWGAGCS